MALFFGGSFVAITVRPTTLLGGNVRIRPEELHGLEAPARRLHPAIQPGRMEREVHENSLAPEMGTW